MEEGVASVGFRLCGEFLGREAQCLLDKGIYELVDNFHARFECRARHEEVERSRRVSERTRMLKNGHTLR